MIKIRFYVNSKCKILIKDTSYVEGRYTSSYIRMTKMID